MKISLVFSLILVLIVDTGFAQETNFWTQQYGTRSTLLGGSVIGSVSDMSATYYNPGALALFQESSILLSARGYELTNTTIEGGGGDGRDISSSAITAIPDLFATDLPFNFLGEGSSLAFSILARNSSKTDFLARGAIDPLSPGGGAGAELIFDNDLSEFWAGLTLSKMLGDNVGVGLTAYLAIRDQDRRSQFLSEELMTSGDIAAAIFINDFSYNHFRAVLKGGLALDFSPVTIGVSLTAPGIGITGSGKGLVNAASTGFDYNQDGTDDNLLIASYQENIPTDFRSPWSVGIGGAYEFANARIHISGEYIGAVDSFAVLDAMDFVGQTTGDTLSVPLTHATKEVFNYAIGIEYPVGERSRLFGSFSTDFSAASSGSNSNLAVVNYNIYHVGFGAAFTAGRWDLIVGGVYAFGKNKIEEAFQVDELSGEASLLEDLRGSDVLYSRIRILFGFSYAL